MGKGCRAFYLLFCCVILHLPMHHNEITRALENILKSQEKVVSIASKLTKQVRNALDSRDMNEVFSIERDLKRILSIQRAFTRDFAALEQVRIARQERAETHRQRQLIAN